jgi:hypothetical protein
VLLVFNRGSGDNPDGLLTGLPFTEDFKKKEAVAGSFFMSFKGKMDKEYPLVTYKAVSVHNFPNLYNPDGYKAVGIFSAQTFLNAVQAEYSWFPFGEYNKSVGDGKAETVGYIKDQIALCPDQRLVLGGYSQGAQVMGESVFLLSSAEREHISALALFGDPKYVGSDISSSSSTLNWFDSLSSIFDRPKAKPWKRGSAGLNDRGLADARIPYVPSDLEYKTLSWCFNDDFVCSGGSGIFQTVVTSIQNGSVPSIADYSNGHTRYATFGAPQAAGEIIQRLAPSISQLDESRGGKDPDGSPAQVAPISPNSKPIDVMMMLNTSAGVDDVLGQMRINTGEVLPPLSYFYSNVLYGIGEYSETGDLPNRRIPKVVIHQSLTANINSLISKMNIQLASRSLSGGGLDAPDPHQLGIERAVMSTTWRKDAEKHVVIISSRLPSSNYTYNICNSDVRIGFGITTTNNCNINPILETDLASQHSERCKNTYDVLTKTNCSVDLANPYYIYNVVRNIDDAITMARAKGVIIDVVVPNTITQFYDSSTGVTYTVPMITAALKRIADSTGGVFLQYSSFTKANYTDMYWRMLNNKSKVLPFAAIEDFDTAGSVESVDPFKSKTIKSNEPILFDATSENSFDEYRWDLNGDGTWDETTVSPSTDYVYESAVGQILAVVAGFKDGAEASRSILPLNVVGGGESVALITPQLPAGLEAIRSGSGVTISWTLNNSGAVIFFGEPTSGLPMASAPLSSGSIVLTNIDDSETNLIVWVEDGSSSSSRQHLSIQSPEPVVESVKVLNESESSPNSQFIGVVNSPEPTVQSNGTGSVVSVQQVLQQTADVTEVKGSESANNELQQASSFTEDDLSNDIDEADNTRNYLLYGIIILILISVGVYGFNKVNR